MARALEPIRVVTGRAVPLLADDVDTDRIIPARYLKCVTFDGLGEAAFYDERFDEAGNARPHPLNDPRFEGASVLISGSNFGCGSSREHAPQALFRFGLRAVLAESFAEIFFGNAITLGMPCLSMERPDLLELSRAVAADPSIELLIDIEAGTVKAGARSYPAGLPASAREALLQGRWDPIKELLAATAQVRRLAAHLPYISGGSRP